MIGRGNWKRPALTMEALESNSIPEPNSGCLLWLGVVNQFGYGRLRRKEVSGVVHRLAYELTKGPVPPGLELDHLCRVRCCINPDHLEPVPKIVNVRRGMAGTSTRQRTLARTHCPKGHPYSGDNLFQRKGTGFRECRICMRERLRQQRAKAR